MRREKEKILLLYLTYDSISAGVAAINVDTPYLHKDQFKEYRGLSFDMGGVGNQ